ncbi:YlmH family RNA-binding protein [Alkalicoccobacillus murimartini]|uniref:RNA-binding protein YlmH n=1 Tax=Alkalicoccobacillus murimartini TaxID=171685 RepID=A0ABT9YFX0_9BACI|nr:YlmH/Sll1252 family protein [Alkalicoccobacillus murimartini]MDQ0206431.1 RNA-binding protein YlmH [Alkalicoccobacillus murimartini]
MTLYDHFRPEERPFIDQVLTWKENAELRHQDKMTDFLDPRQQDIVQSLIGQQDDVLVKMWGGATGTERSRAYIHPSYLVLDPDEWPLTLLEASYPVKFIQLSHRDVLGALMGSGLRREKFGDMTVDDGRIQLIVASESADYVRMNVLSAGRATIDFQERSLDHFHLPEEKWIEAAGTISSLRLDTVLAQIYRVSRSKAADAVERGLVKVNWRQTEQSAFVVREGDHLSVRGWGRSRLLMIEGTTKKEKIRARWAKKG